MASRRHPDPGRRASIETQAHPGHSAARTRLALKAVVFGLLLNGCDRQAGLRHWRIGREIVRTPEGNWIPAYRQGKTGKIKDNGALWAPVSAIIDQHVLGDRPAWAIQARVAELDGKHLFALGPEPIGCTLVALALPSSGARCRSHRSSGSRRSAAARSSAASRRSPPGTACSSVRSMLRNSPGC